ncbi:hypothetical protein BGZ59_004500 [Podila verticillata]|nr:hypothetical protein BGZ59_004500 [Podila verticillata]
MPSFDLVRHIFSTLRQELPQFFDQGLCNNSIYASNIRLIEASHTNVSLQGKTIYFLLAGAVRWSFKMWFRDLEFEIQSIRVNDRGGRGRLGGMTGDWDRINTSYTTQVDLTSTINTSQIDTDDEAGLGQKDSPVDHGRVNPPQVKLVDTDQGQAQVQNTPPSTSVTVRWTLKGTTRPSVVLTMSGPTAPPPSSFAGVFVYEFDDRGLVDEHRIENIMPSPSPEAIQRAFAWWGWLLSRTRPAAATSEVDATRKRLGLGCFSSKQ